MEQGRSLTYDGPVWDWPLNDCFEAVARVRAGRSLKPSRWPGNAPGAFVVSFDSDHETVELSQGKASPGKLSWCEYSSRVGVPRIRSVLKRHGVPATFFVPAVSALLHEREQADLAQEGHEIGLHGWIHESNSTLDQEVERDLVLRSADVLEKITGNRPIGIRTPSVDFSESTAGIIKEAGLLYDSSLMADDDCYEIDLEGAPSGIVEIPFDWIRDDAAYFVLWQDPIIRPHISPNDVFGIWEKELVKALECGGHFQLVLHPNVIGPRSRIWILEELIDRAKSLGAWFATHGELAKYVLEHSSAA